MEFCTECGNAAVASRHYDSVTVLECELCGALHGTPAAVRTVLDARAARAAGLDPRVYGLARVLDGLPGLRLSGADAGDRVRRALPAIAWQLVDRRGLLQVENLAKSLLLSARSFAVPWAIEVEYRDALTFVLRPRPAGVIGEAEVTNAQLDLRALARALERDVRLSWWRRADDVEP